MADMVFSCEACGVGFEQRSGLKNHNRKAHQEEVRATLPGYSVEAIKRGPDGELKCICGKSFTLPDSVRRHAKTCKGDEVTVVASEDDELELGMAEDVELLRRHHAGSQ
jgi:bifunctional DNA-binding transcriptional regulator/antitoxin component of YhaV-PrlF toxin-antitoxin module